MLTELLLLTLSLALPRTDAIWPFPPKRFSGNSLLGAGSMGVDGNDKVIAYGDFNGDQLCVYDKSSTRSICLTALQP